MSTETKNSHDPEFILLETQNRIHVIRREDVLRVEAMKQSDFIVAFTVTIQDHEKNSVTSIMVGGDDPNCDWSAEYDSFVSCLSSKIKTLVDHKREQEKAENRARYLAKVRHVSDVMPVSQ